MRLPAVPRTEVVSRLARVFRDAGFERASLSQLAEVAGLQRSSLYHFFPRGKRQMAEEVLEQSNALFEAEVLAKLSAAGEPRDRLVRMLESIEHYYRNGEDACLLGLFAVEHQKGRIGRLIRSGFLRWRALLADLFESGGFGRSESIARANEVIALIQGALVVSRGLGDVKLFGALMKRIRDHAFA